MKHAQTPLVLVFSTSYSPAIGGAEIAIEEIVKRSSHLRFLIITARALTRAPRFEQSGTISIRRVGFGVRFDKWLLPVLGFFAGWKTLRQERRAILWGMMISQGTIAAYFLKLFHPRVPLVVTLQEGDSEEHIERARGGLIHFFWRAILRKADGVTAISAYLAKRAQDAGFEGEVSIIPNGVDENYVSQSFEGAPVELFKQELGILPEKRAIISVSRLSRKNGIADLIQAFSLLRHDGINVALLLVGTGEEQQTLQSLVKKLHIERDVIFVGNIPHEELFRYYRMSDVFARPSHSEGLGNSFLEAMGAGVPVVATSVGGIKDFIENGKTGIFVKPGDARSIADGILKILNNDDLAEELRRQGRELMIRKYLWVDIAKNMEDFLREHIS
ncbi:MAG: glycosyltransferase family 4 protein [Patescibacteria group bacterium]